MDFRRRKLRLALWIMALGMLVAVIWHGWQGWGLGRGYPDNTFLSHPAIRFSDLWQTILYANNPNPCGCSYAVYFPAVYPAVKYLGRLDQATQIYLYLVGTLAALVGAAWLTLQPLALGPIRHLAVAMGLVLFSYPVWFGLDRGNLEIPMSLFVMGALLCFRARRWRLGLACLFPPVCVKLYPLLLTALFPRSRHWPKAALLVVLFVAATLLSLETFQVPLEKSWEEWSHWQHLYYVNFIIGNWGFSGTTSAWNTVKAVLLGSYAFGHLGYRPGFDNVADALVQQAFLIYSFLALATFVVILAHALFIEMVFFRRAILLLLDLIVIIPTGADYRLIYVNIALVVLIMLPRMRRHDLLVTGLLAFALVPKKELFLTFLGPTDSIVNDISVGILINPPCLLAAIVLLVWDGMGKHPLQYARYRIFGLAGSVRQLMG
jgi:hypothetical protein